MVTSFYRDFNKTYGIKKVRCFVSVLFYIDLRIVYASAAIRFNADPATYHPICPSL